MYLSFAISGLSQNRVQEYLILIMNLFYERDLRAERMG